MIFETLRFVLVEIFWSILYFPVWWYTAGTMKVAHLVVKEVRAIARAFNLKILLKFLFQPMFGYRDFWSRVISLYVRIGHFIILSIISLIYTVALSAVLLLWIVLPPFVLANLLFHLGIIPLPYA